MPYVFCFLLPSHAVLTFVALSISVLTCESCVDVTAIQTGQFSLLCLWRSLIFEQKETKTDVGDGINSQCLGACSFCCLFIIQEPYARKREINQKPYKVENISKNIGLSEFSSEEVTELHGIISWAKDEVIIRQMFRETQRCRRVCVLLSLCKR